jgi:hypothetical protein
MVTRLEPIPQKQNVSNRTYRRLQSQKEQQKFAQRLNSDIDYSNQINLAIKNMTVYVKKYTQQEQDLEKTMEKFISDKYPNFSNAESHYVLAESQALLKELPNVESRLHTDTEYANQMNRVIKDVTAYVKKYALQQRSTPGEIIQKYIFDIYPEFSNIESYYVFAESKTFFEEDVKWHIASQNNQREAAMPTSPDCLKIGNLRKDTLLRAQSRLKKRTLVHYAPINIASNVSSNT